MLESDLSYTRAMLDGQTAVLDDYLEVRPEARAPHQARATDRLVDRSVDGAHGRPMVSGETMVRDIQLGITRFGVRRRDGRSDTSRHVRARRVMPQILRLAGFEHAVVWRGVPASVEQTGALWWRRPTARVRAEYLYGSYLERA
jgi:hypothetical protein